MPEKIWSPVLDYDMIKSKLDLFSNIDGFNQEYAKTRAKLFGRCGNCGNTIQRDFAQYVRNKIVEGKLTHITKQLDPRTIIRYKNNIYRASEII